MKDGEELKAFLSEYAVMHDTGKKKETKRECKGEQANGAREK